MRYRINFGDHYLDGRRYQTGDVIETDIDLVKSTPIYDVARRLWKFSLIPPDPVKPPFMNKDNQ